MSSTVSGQTVNNPTWIIGSWGNTMISDLRNSVVWTFTKDSIYIEYGISQKEKKCLSRDYPEYKQSTILKDNLLKIVFTKNSDTVEYEFKQGFEDGVKKPSITYSLTINGKKQVDHSKSADLVFIKK
jgi:hypothetical protein